METGATTAGNGPGSLRTERTRRSRTPSRLRRRAPAIAGSADRRRRATSPSADPSVRRVRQTPNEGGTAEGTTFRPRDDGRFFIVPCEDRAGLPQHRPGGADEPMTTTDPLSLTEAKRLVGNADTILLASHPRRRPRDPDRRLPPSRRRRTGLPARVGRGRRAARAVQLPRRRPAPAPRGPRRRRHDPDPTARRCDVYAPDLPTVADDRPRPAGRPPRLRAPSSRAARRRDAPVHRRRGRRAGLRRGLELRADRPAPGRRPGRRPDRRLHRDRPRPRLRPPDPHDERDRQPPHRRARLRGPLRDRRAGDLRGPRADRPTEPGRAGGGDGGPARRRSRREPHARHACPAVRGPDRDQPRTRRLHPGGRDGQGRDRRRRGDPGRPGPTPVVRPPDRVGRRGDRRDRSLPGAPTGQPQPVPLLRPDALVRGRRGEPGAPPPGPRATG